ncbi:MAG: PorV/PorQ family protein [Bacteroidetes bacterium]|nr:PorV/PorQ family protein [Bacteroidota bacterium]
MNLRLNTSIALFGLLSLLFVTQEVSAQSKVGTTAAPFLTMGTGARANGVGHAYTAIATGPDALFWNPAGISVRFEDDDPLGGIVFSNKSWLAGINYNALAMTIPVSSSRDMVLGLHAIFLDYGRMDIRTVEQPEGNGLTFGAYDLSTGISFASRLTDSFHLGGTVKYVQQSIYDMRASTVAVDIGFTLVTPYMNGIRIGASLTNFGGKMQMDGINTQFVHAPFRDIRGANDNVTARYTLDEWNIPVQFKFGVLWPLIVSEYVDWYVMAESDQTNDQYLNADLGSQLVLKTRTTRVIPRIGYKDFPLDRDFAFNQVDSHWTFGIGLQTRVNRMRFAVDFAYIPFENLGDTSMIDLRFYF